MLKRGMKTPLFSYKFYMLFKFNSAKCVLYAKNYSMSKNPFYIKFDDEKEGCNFVSQCVLAGCENLSKNNCNEWYYENETKFSETWVNIELFIKYLLVNKTCGPTARVVNRNNLSAGDIVVVQHKDRKEIGIVSEIENDEIFYISGLQKGEMKILESEKNALSFLHIVGVFK